MKPKKAHPKLRLHREVLAHLEAADLGRVAGGVRFTVDSRDNCTGNSRGIPECTANR